DPPFSYQFGCCYKHPNLPLFSHFIVKRFRVFVRRFSRDRRRPATIVQAVTQVGANRACTASYRTARQDYPAAAAA
ncbi:hypothetical protein ABLN72_11775, partial [Mycobacterium tuberculosis]